MASITYRGEYQWQVKIRRRGYPSQSKTFESKSDAEKWARMIESEMDRGVFRPLAESERTTLQELLERYSKEVSPTKNGWEQERSRLRVIGRYPLSEFAIANIDGKALAEYRDTRLREVAKATVVSELSLIGNVFKVAIKDWGYVLPHGNPIDAVRKPKIGNNRRDRRLYSGEEERLLAAAEEYGGMIRSIIILALETGMRRGELAKLQWKHVNIKERAIHLPREVTKTDEDRDVPLSTRAISVLKALPRRIDGSVFGVRADSITQAFGRVCKLAKDEKGKPSPVDDLRFHDLRHEAASRLFERGFNQIEVASITGHKTLQMLKRYTHLRAQDLAKRLG